MILVRGIRVDLNAAQPEKQAQTMALKILRIRESEVAQAGVHRKFCNARLSHFALTNP